MADDTNKPTKVDYTPLFLNGLSSEQITGATKDKNLEVSMLPEDQAFSKYTAKGGIYEGLDQNKFHEAYSQALDSYSKYQKNQFNGNVAPLWEYDKDLKGNVDLSQPSTGYTPAGYDKYGRMVATPGEVAAKRGYIQDGDKQIPYKEPGFWSKLWKVPTGLLGEMVMPELSPLMQGDDPSKVVILDKDKDGSPFYRTASADDPTVLRSQILSSWGPQALQENWYSALLKGFYNGIIDVESIEGTVMEGAGKAIDFVSSNKDDNNWLEKRGRLYENLAQKSKIPVGVSGSGDMFSSWSAASYAIGSLIPIVLLTRGAGGALEGAGMGEAAAHEAGTFAVFSGLGMDSYVGAAKENGVDPADIFWQASLVGIGQGAAGLIAGPSFLTGKLASAEFKAGMQKMISKEMSDEGVKFGVDSFSKLPAEAKQNFISSINTKIADFWKNNLTDVTTKTGKLVLGAHGMGSMMAAMEIPDVGVQTFNDWRALLKNPNSAPGKGQFENYDTNKSFLANVWDRLPNKMLQSYVNGFVTGLAYTPLEAGLQKGFGTLTGKDSPTIFSSMKPLSNENIVSMGKTEDALKVYSDIHDKGQFGSTSHYADGTPIVGDKDPDKPTENDARYQAALDDLNLTQQVADQYGSKKDVFGGNIAIFRDVIKTGKDINDLTKQLAETPDDPEILKNLDDAKRHMTELMVPEEGTKFSKVYNDKIKTGRVSTYNVIDATDKEYLTTHDELNEDSRKTKEWLDLFDKNSKRDDLKNGYQSSQVFYDKVDEEVKRRTDLNNKRVEDEQTLIPTTIPAIREEIKNTLKEKDDTKIIEGVRKVTGMIKSVANKIDMSRQADVQNEFIDMQGKLVSEAGYRPQPDDATMGYGVALTGAFQGSDELFKNNQTLLSTDKNDVTDDLLSGDIKKQVDNEIPLLVASKQGQQRIKSVGDDIKNNQSVVPSLAFLNDNLVKPHISKRDIVLPYDKADEHLNALNTALGKLNQYRFINEENLHNVSDKYFAQHIEKNKRALETLTPAFQKFIPNHSDILKGIDIPQSWHELDYPLSDGDRKKLNEYNKALVDLKSKIFDARKDINLSEAVKDLIAIRNPQTIGETYLGGHYFNDDYKQSLDALYQIKSGVNNTDPMLKTKGGIDLYPYVINTLIESMGVHAGSVELARLKATTLSDDISDPHMQQAENLTFAFMNGGHDVLQQVLDAEREALLKNGVSKDDIDDAQRNFIKNAIFVNGDSGTGKSTRFLKGLYDLVKNYDEIPKKVAVIGVSDNNNETIKAQIPDATFYKFSDLSTKDITDLKNTDHIIIDEAQRFDARQIGILKDHLVGSNTLVFLGDPRQTHDDQISSVGVKPMPFTERKVNNNSLVTALHEVFRGIGGLPNGFVDANGDGLRYYKTKQEVTDAFFGDPSENKALILSQDDIDCLPYVTDTRKVYTLDNDNPVRGSMFSKVYIGLDRDKSDYYTATGRATNFIAMSDDKAENKLNKEDTPWVDTEPVKTDKTNELARLGVVTGEAQHTPSDTPEKEKTDPQEILPVTGKPVIEDIFRVIGDKAKDGKGYYAKVVDVNGDKISVLRGDEGEQTNKDNLNLSDLGYRDPMHQQQYETPQAPKEVQQSREEHYQQAGSYMTFHTGIGDMTPDNLKAKRAIAPLIPMLDKDFDIHVVYKGQARVTDDKDNTITQPDVLAIRADIKPGSDVSTLAERLGGRVGSKLPAEARDKVIDDIKESLKTTGQLPEYLRYLGNLGKPNKAMNGNSEYIKLSKLVSDGKRGTADANGDVILGTNLPMLGADEYSLQFRKFDDNDPKSYSLQEFIDKNPDIKFWDMIEATTEFQTGTMKQTLWLRYNNEDNIGSRAVVQTKKLRDVGDTKAIISEWKANDPAIKKWSSSVMQNTDFMQFLKNNWGAMKKNGQQQYIRKNFGKMERDGNSYVWKPNDKGKEAYEKLFQYVIDNPDLFKDRELPFFTKYVTKELLKSPEASNFIVRGDIHSPFTFVDIKKIGQAKSTVDKAKEFIAGVEGLIPNINKPSEPEYWYNDEKIPEGTKKRIEVGKTPTPEQAPLIYGGNKEQAYLGTDPVTGLKVYEVDGNYIRGNIYDDFTAGGNEHAYPNFVPKGEIWVEKDLIGKSRQTTITHEITEKGEMDTGKDYSNNKDGGHEVAKEDEHQEIVGEAPPTELVKEPVQQEPVEESEEEQLTGITTKPPPTYEEKTEALNKKLNDIVGEGKGLLTDANTANFKRLESGKIKQEMEGKDIISNDKSEFFYMVHNYMLTEKNNKGIMADIKKAMSYGSDTYKGKTKTDTQAYEWIANNIDNLPDKSSAKLKSFVSQVNGMYSRYKGGRVESRELFREGDNKPYQEFSDGVAVDVERKAIDYFGTTESLRSAGYLTMSGQLLDLSGSKYGSTGGGREQDHREINSVLEGVDLGKYETETQWQGTSSGGMLAFMDMGNIRIMPESGGIDMNNMPTQEQFTQLRKIISRKNGEIILDLNNYSGSGVSTEYDKGTPTDKIIQDIKDWYHEGKYPNKEEEQWDSRKLNNLQSKRLTQKSFDILLNKFKQAFPQINFIQENSESLQAKGVNPKLIAYDDAEGTHYNIDAVREDTGVHELQHIWNKIFKLRNPEEYAKIEQDTKDAINDKGSDTSRLSDKIREVYPELNEQQHLDEVMATIGGFTSVEAVQRFLDENDVSMPPEDKTFAQRIYDSVKGVVTRLWDGIKSFLGLKPDFQVDGNFYKDFTDKIFNGETFHFSPQELKVIQSIGAEQRDNRIFGISDMVRTLSPEHNDSLRYANMDEESLTDLIFNNVKDKGKDNQGTYIYMSPTKGVEYVKLTSTDDEELKKEIKQKIVPRYQILDVKTSDAVKKVVEYINSPLARDDSFKGKARTAYDMVQNIMGKDISYKVANDLVNLTGIAHGAEEVLRYAELPGHKNEKVRELFKDGLEGFNPLVVIHGYDSSGKPDISLLDITSYGQGEEAVPGKTNNIFGSLMDDKAYQRAGGPKGWNDKLYSYRKLLLGIQALGMDASFRRLTVLQVKKDQVKPYQINDIEEVNKLLNVLSKNTQFMDNIGDSTVKGLIASKRAVGKTFGTPFIEQLQNYLKVAKEATSDLLEDDPYQQSVLARYNTFSDTHATKQDWVKALTAWQRDLNKSIPDNDSRFSDPTYQLVSATLNDLKKLSKDRPILNRPEEIDIKAIHLIETPSALVPSDFIQAQVISMGKSIAQTLRAWDEYHQKTRELFSKVAKQQQAKLWGKQLVSDVGNDLFDHLYKKIDAVATKDMEYDGKKYAKGDHVQVRSNILIQKGDPEANKLTPEALELNRVVLEELKQRAIDNIYWEHILHDGDSVHDDTGNPTYTREMAESQYNDMSSRGLSGHVPTIELSANNLIMKGKFKDGIEKWKNNVTKPEEQFADIVGDEGIKQLFGSFNQQMKNPAATYEKMGLAMVDDGATTHMELFDPKANLNASHNLERVGNYFMLKGIRDEMIGKEYLPEYNTQMALLTAYELANDAKLPHVRNFIQQYMNRYQNRRNADEQLNAGNIELPGGGKISLGTASRTTTAGLTGVLLMFKYVTSAKVFASGAFNSFIHSIANSASNIGLSPEQADNLFPGAGDFLSASAKMFTSPRKMFAIAQKFMYVNMNENSLLKYPSKNESMKKDFASKGIGMAPEQWTDMSLRVLSLASMMVKNGAWDAYSLTKEGLQWDRLKDKRYFNPDGSQTPEQKSLYTALVDRMKDHNEMAGDAKYPDRGDDDFMINNQYKWYANQFSYPGIDDATKSLATNNWVGGLLFMFKSFLLPRMYNAGVGAGTHEFESGGTFKPHLDESTGEWVTELEKRTMEGQYQSWRKAINDIMSAKSYSPAEFAKWWKEQKPQTRQNLIASTLYAGAMAGLAYWLIPGMSKRDEKRFSYYYSELMLGYSAIDWMKNPVPIINTTLRVTQVAMGQKKFNTITQSVGPISGVKRIVTTVGK